MENALIDDNRDQDWKEDSIYTASYDLKKNSAYSCESFIKILAEVPGTAWAYLQPAENLLFCKKMCPSAYRVSIHQAQGVRAGVKPGPRPSFDRWGCACKISSRSVKGFGFPLALHISTDRQTSVCPFIYIYRIEDI